MADKRQHVENRMETQQQLMESWREQYGCLERGEQRRSLVQEETWGFLCVRPEQGLI